MCVNDYLRIFKKIFLVKEFQCELHAFYCLIFIEILKLKPKT